MSAEVVEGDIASVMIDRKKSDHPNCLCLQGMSIETIAEVRHLKLDTVESYLAEAITAGRAYDWHRMRVTDSGYAMISQHVSAQLSAAGEPKEAGRVKSTGTGVFQQEEGVLQQSISSRGKEVGAEGSQQQEASLPQSQSLSSNSECEVCCAQPSHHSHAEKENCLQAKSLQLERLCRPAGAQEHCNMSSSSAQDWRGSSSIAPVAGQALIRRESQKVVDDRYVHSMPSVSHKAIEHYSKAHLCPSRSAATMRQPAEAGAHTKDSAAVMGGHRAPVASNDVLGKLQDAGCSIKALKEELPESIRFGQIRLCLAHMGRLSSLS